MTEKWKSRTGEEKAKTTWVKIVCWGKLAESVVAILNKGDLALVEGKISTRSYEKDEITYQVTEIEATNVLKTDGNRKNTSIESESDNDTIQTQIEE